MSERPEQRDAESSPVQDKVPDTVPDTVPDEEPREAKVELRKNTVLCPHCGGVVELEGNG